MKVALINQSVVIETSPWSFDVLEDSVYPEAFHPLASATDLGPAAGVGGRNAWLTIN